MLGRGKAKAVGQLAHSAQVHQAEGQNFGTSCRHEQGFWWYWVVVKQGSGFRTTVVSMPSKSAMMGEIADLNPGHAPLPDDHQQQQDVGQAPQTPGYEPSLLDDRDQGQLEELEFEDMQQLIDGDLEVELQELEEHQAEQPWPLPPLPTPPRRVRGKQRPAVRGLMTEAFGQCNGCGLQQPRLSKCHFCNEPAVPAGGSGIAVMEFMKMMMEFKVKFKTINDVAYKNWIIWLKG